MPKNSEGYDWEKDLVTFLFVNLDHKGEDMSHSVNGRAFVIKDQKTNTAPRAVFNVLNELERTEYEISGEKDGPKTVRPKQVKLYFCKIMEPEEIKEEAKKKSKVVQDILNEDNISASDKD